MRSSFSVVRYFLIHDGFTDAASNGGTLDVQGAINVTAIVANKGKKDPYRCQSPAEGSNILR